MPMITSAAASSTAETTRDEKPRPRSSGSNSGSLFTREFERRTRADVVDFADPSCDPGAIDRALA